MYRSAQKEFQLIFEAEHIIKITKLIENNFDNHFRLIIDKYHTNNSCKNDTECIRRLFGQRIEEFEKEAKEYKGVFNKKDLESIVSAGENRISIKTKDFKSNLTKKCPVIKYSFNSRVKELEDWRILFAKADAKEIFELFKNLLNFAEDYSENHEDSEYEEYVTANDFNFDEIEEEDYSLIGVIGMGIKSVTIYHLYPHIFPKRGKSDLFGMYFLTGQDKSFFDFPTKTSEFIMINDEATGQKGTYKVDQNYWYPYGLFTAYAMKIYKMIVERCKQINVALDPHHRYVYVNTYLEKILDILTAFHFPRVLN
jgi:hypothetical protein